MTAVNVSANVMGVLVMTRPRTRALPDVDTDAA
jgi:hypothetical protein